GARSVNTLEIRNRNLELHRFAGRVVSLVTQSQHIVSDFCGNEIKNVIVALDFDTQVFLTGDFDRESTFSFDRSKRSYVALLQRSPAGTLDAGADPVMTSRSQQRNQQRQRKFFHGSFSFSQIRVRYG